MNCDNNKRTCFDLAQALFCPAMQHARKKNFAKTKKIWLCCFHNFWTKWNYFFKFVMVVDNHMDCNNQPQKWGKCSFWRFFFTMRTPTAKSGKWEKRWHILQNSNPQCKPNDKLPQKGHDTSIPKNPNWIQQKQTFQRTMLLIYCLQRITGLLIMW